MRETALRDRRRNKLNHRAFARAGCTLAIALTFTGCDDLPGKPNPADRPILPSQVLDFETLYQQNCAGCHGADGDLGPAPPLNDPLFLAIVPDAELLKTIAAGRAGTPMPPFSQSANGKLTEDQVLVLAAGVKKHWQGATETAAGIPPYLQPADGAGDAERGVVVFARACANCHGVDGRGDHDATAGAINDRSFLALISEQALRRIIITGRPDLGMPNFAETDGRDDDFRPLTSNEIDDLVALLASWRKATSPNAANPSQP